MDKKKTGIYVAGGILLFLAGVGFSQMFMFASSGRVDPQQIVVAFKNPVCTAPTVINCPHIRKLPEMRPNRVQPEREMSPLPKCDCPRRPCLERKCGTGFRASVWPEPDKEEPLHLKPRRRAA